MSGTLRLRGATSGYSELQAPAVAADQTFILPTAGGTLLTTDSPVAKLTLELGSASQPSLTFEGDTDTGLYSSGTNTLNLVTGGSDRLVINSSGNVGIGTTSPSALLDVAGGNIFLTEDNNILWQNAARDTNRGAIQFTSGGEFRIRYGALLTEALRINSSGSVGIGTTSPGDKLTVGDTADSFNSISIESTNTGIGELRFADSDSANPAYVKYEHTGNNLIFAVNASERMRIDSSGNVGIGTSSPGNKLSVNGYANAISGFTVGNEDGNTSGGLYNAGSNSNSVSIIADPNGAGANSRIGFFVDSTSTEAGRIDSVGRWLLNQTVSSPSASDIGAFLQINEGSGVAVSIHRNSGADAFAANLCFRKSRSTSADGTTLVVNNDALGQIQFMGTDGDQAHPGAQIQAAVDGTASNNVMPGRLMFFTNGGGTTVGERMRIDSAGNVGIGTTNPGVKLVVEEGAAPSGFSQTNINILRSNYGGQIGGYIDQGVSHGLTFSTVDTGTATERLRIDGAGRMLLGTSSSLSTKYFGASFEPNFQHAAGAGTAGFYRFKADADGSTLILSKSRNTSIGSHTVVNNNDTIGVIGFAGSDGTEFETAAVIRCQVDGTPGTNDMPGRLIFSTTADGASSPTERMRINSSGEVSAQGIYDTTSGGAANVYIHPTNYILHRSTSSIKYKTNIETLQDQYADALLSCRPVWYQSVCKYDNPNWGHWGFIAEEVAEIDPRLVSWKTHENSYDENGAATQIPLENPEPEGVQYDRFVPHLLNLIKRQQQAIETLEANNLSLENRIAALENN